MNHERFHRILLLIIYYIYMTIGFFLFLVRGILKGFDGLMNLVLDESKESIRDHQNKEETEESIKTRDLGLIVVRGPQIVVISPTDGAEEIANPFLQSE